MQSHGVGSLVCFFFACPVKQSEMFDLAGSTRGGIAVQDTLFNKHIHIVL
jgi:hypothetical protein